MASKKLTDSQGSSGFLLGACAGSNAQMRGHAAGSGSCAKSSELSCVDTWGVCFPLGFGQGQVLQWFHSSFPGQTQCSWAIQANHSFICMASRLSWDWAPQKRGRCQKASWQLVYPRSGSTTQVPQELATRYACMAAWSPCPSPHWTALLAAIKDSSVPWAGATSSRKRLYFWHDTTPKRSASSGW